MQLIDFRTGARVHWNRGQVIARGRITEKFECRVEKTIKGVSVARLGSHRNPAYLVKTDNGEEVLKLGSELHQA